MLDNVKPLKALQLQLQDFCLAFVFYIRKNNVNLQNVVT